MLNVYKDLTLSISNYYTYASILLLILISLIITHLFIIKHTNHSKLIVLKRIRSFFLILSIIGIAAVSCIIYLSNSDSHIKKLNESEYTLQVSNDHNYITLKNQAKDKTFMKITDNSHKLIANQLEIIDESDEAYFVKAADGQESITLTLNKNQYHIESN